MKRQDELKKYRSMAEKELQAVVLDLKSKIRSAQAKLIAGELKDSQEVAKLKKSLARSLTLIKEAAQEKLSPKAGGSK